ncbi:uncharacterized protein HD556DRAFT_1381031 [Suillus plorans]|uniref:Uncharacterized protein n=1 Tax=Suillus plorans TaxID=116603 RepID=A0A9P7ANK1_9AGAM|nr:uncharacterized protein HD556DRAFT_1381031 [Suillus plorans]KAG1792139.1 hypothetical protein HD556DRAFT_1381031 [Suillus plorans]
MHDYERLGSTHALYNRFYLGFVELGGGSLSGVQKKINMPDAVRILDGMTGTLVIDVSACFALLLILAFVLVV